MAKPKTATKVPFGLGVRNVDAEIAGDVLTLKIDMSERHGTTKNGKRARVASTGGSVFVTADGFRLGLNLTAPLPATEE